MSMTKSKILILKVRFDFNNISWKTHTKILWFMKFHTKLWLVQNLCILLGTDRTKYSVLFSKGLDIL